MASPEEWFKNLPLVTKTYLTSAVATTALITFGTITPLQIYLDFTLIFQKFEIWRLVTNFLFFGKFSFPFVFQMFILQQYTSFLEKQRFASDRGRAELIHCFMFGMLGMVLVAFLFGGIPFLGQPLIFMNLYIWSRTNPNNEVNFWGFKFQAWHLPFVLMAVGMLMGGSPINDCIGVFIGHIYHFLMDVVPKVYGIRLLRCPEFLYNYFDPRGRAVQTNQRMGTGYRVGS